MRGAPGNSDGTRRTRAGTSCDPMRRTRKEIGRPTSADGIDTVTGTMPRRPLLSPCGDGGKAHARPVRGTARWIFRLVVRKGERARTKKERPPLPADNYRRRGYRTCCGAGFAMLLVWGPFVA